MADIGGDEPHVTELLGLYYLDTLGPAEGALIEAHLPECAQCREAAEQVIDTVAVLALLSERDREEMLDNFGALNRTGPPSERFVRFFAPDFTPDLTSDLAPKATTPKNGGEQAVEAEPAPAPEQLGRQPRRLSFMRRKADRSEPKPMDPPPVAPAPVALTPIAVAKKPVPIENPMPVVRAEPVAKAEPPPPSAPTEPRPSVTAAVREELVAPPRRRPSVRDRRRPALIRLSCLLVLVLVLGALALGALLHGNRDAGAVAVPVVTAAATAADRSTGASLSVFVTQREDGVSVRATVDGLRSGAGYRLQAVTSDGHAWPVVNWTSDGKLQDITAEVPVPLSALVFFTVSRAGSGPVVSAYLGPGTP